jgi:hypothetical protein
MVLLDRFRIQFISGNLRAESTILFPIVWGHIDTFEVDTLGVIHHQDPLVGSCIWFLSGYNIDRPCRCLADQVRIQDAGQKRERIWELLCLEQAQKCHYSRFLVSRNVLLPPSLLFSCRRQIDESPSLVINQTQELFSHWWGSPSLSRVFLPVAASPSSWSWSILAWVRSAVDLRSLGPWGETRESSSLAGVGSKELECVGFSSRQRSWIWFRPSKFWVHKQLCFVGPRLCSQQDQFQERVLCWSFLQLM